SVQNLSIESGGLSGTGTLTVTGSATWSGGFMGAGNGSTVIAPNATLAISGSANKNLDSRTLTHPRTITWTGAGDVGLSDVAAVVNAGTFLDQGDHSAFDNGGNNSTFTNSGTYIKAAGSATGSTFFDQPFFNSGTAVVQAGTVQINRGGAASGAFNIGA